MKIIFLLKTKDRQEIPNDFWRAIRVARPRYRATESSSIKDSPSNGGRTVEVLVLMTHIKGHAKIVSFYLARHKGLEPLTFGSVAIYDTNF